MSKCYLLDTTTNNEHLLLQEIQEGLTFKRFWCPFWHCWGTKRFWPSIYYTEDVNVPDDNTSLKDNFHKFNTITNDRFEHINNDIMNITYVITETKDTLTGIVTSQTMNSNYYNTVNSYTHVLSCLKIYIVAQ